MKKILKYSLVIILILSLLFNVWLLFSLEYLDSQWEDIYDRNQIQWCELSNDWARISNDLVLELQYYDEAYDEIEWIEEIDCWETED